MSRTKELPLNTLTLILALSAATFAGLSHAQGVDPREWHEHCEMTIHRLPIKARVLADESRNISIATGGVNCKVTRSYDYERNPHTLVDIQVAVKPPLNTALRTAGFLKHETLQGHVDDREACAGAVALANKTFRATLKRKLIVQEWSTPKNTDLMYAEDVLLSLGNGLHLYSKQLHTVKGRYCAQRPTR